MTSFAATTQALPALPTLETVTDIIVNQKLGNCVPVFVQLPADLLTPVMAYLRVAKDSRYSFMLESVTGGENVGRYSFIGAGTCPSRGNRCIRYIDPVWVMVRSLQSHTHRSGSGI